MSGLAHTWSRATWLLGATLAIALPVAAQTTPAGGGRLASDPAVAAALAAVEAGETATIADQIRLCEIAAPPFGEAERAGAYRDMLEAVGLRAARIDAAGNVLAERPGRGEGPHLVLGAHLDTVFPEGTDVRVTRDGAVLHGPGIGDDCRGLAALLGVARALDQAAVVTDGPITFVGTVGEEGLGDLRGVKHLVNVELRDRIDRFVAIDGTGFGITHVAVGSHRYRVRIQGPGGHSYGSFGTPNPIHALGRALDTIARFEVPRRPKTTFSVGRVGGGTSINAIASEAWMEVDMRSSDAAALQDLDRQFHRAVEAGVDAEQSRWGGAARLTVQTELVGDRPAGRTPRDSEIVRAAVDVTRALGLPVSLGEGSTDANFPISRGIPAITVASGGQGRGSHAPDESFDTTESWKGTQRILLLAIALTQR